MYVKSTSWYHSFRLWSSPCWGQLEFPLKRGPRAWAGAGLVADFGSRWRGTLGAPQNGSCIMEKYGTSENQLDDLGYRTPIFGHTQIHHWTGFEGFCLPVLLPLVGRKPMDFLHIFLFTPASISSVELVFFCASNGFIFEHLNIPHESPEHSTT